MLQFERRREMMYHSLGVTDVHDLHGWNLCSHHALLSAHVVIAEESASQAQEVMDELSRHLLDDFGIEHATLQMEFRCCGKGSACRT